MDLLEEGSLSTAEALKHWYYRAKFALLSGHLREAHVAKDAPLTDVGCGGGLFLRMLRRSGRPPEALVGIDIGYETAVTDAVDGYTVYPGWPGGRGYRAVLMMDVLEHCPDDLKVLQDATDRLQDGGVLFITVPAFQALWSSHDVFLKHCRRYTRARLGALIAREPRLEVESLHYFYGLLFPAAAVQRWLHRGDRNPKSSEMKRLPALLNALLHGICRLELVICRWNRLAGLTVVARCRRRQAPPEGYRVPERPASSS